MCICPLPLIGACTPAPRRAPPHLSRWLQLPTFQFASKRRQRLDSRPLLLFDVNGVLMQHRWDGVSHHVSGRCLAGLLGGVHGRRRSLWLY